MSDPRRLSEGGGSDLEASLLRSARADGPSPFSRRKALVALGLAGSIGAVTTTTATTTATAALVKSSGTMVLLKWIGAGVVGGLLTLGAVEIVHPDEPLPPIAPARVAASPRTGSPVGAPKPVAQVEPRREIVTPAPQAPEADTAPPAEEAPPKPAQPAPSAKPNPFVEEMALIDAARAALAAGDASKAMRLLDERDRRFARGTFGQETTVVRIEALVHRGDRAAALRLGQAFLDAHPRSTAGSHVRSLLGLSAVPAPASSAP
jgi:hypothetical protein